MKLLLSEIPASPGYRVTLTASGSDKPRPPQRFGHVVQNGDEQGFAGREVVPGSAPGDLRVPSNDGNGRARPAQLGEAIQIRFKRRSRVARLRSSCGSRRFTKPTAARASRGMTSPPRGPRPRRTTAPIARRGRRRRQMRRRGW